MSRFLKRGALVLLVLLPLVGGLAAWIVRDRLAPVAAGDETAVPFTVERGIGLAQVAHRLEQHGLLRDWRAFVALARWNDAAAKLHAGEYLLSPGLSAAQILDYLTSGRVRTYEVAIPEGLRAREIAERLESAGLVEPKAFLEAVHDPAFAQSLGIEAASLQGYLFPETYRLPRGLAAREVARVMVEQFLRVWVSEIAPRLPEAPAGPSGLDLDRHQIVTLASIVEKETGAAEERPLIAAVFLNRLRRGMRLETDPTVIFGIADFDGNLKKAHLLDAANPYNTYKIFGLPPGPIASPGREALLAVVAPAQTDFLYFVSRGDGTHKFSKSYAEHDRAVDEFQRRRRR